MRKHTKADDILGEESTADHLLGESTLHSSVKIELIPHIL